MAEIRRTAQAAWQGDARSGQGQVSSQSGVLNETPYTWRMRFEGAPGTNPEELIAAAEASCFTMALAATLGRNNHPPESLYTSATLIMDTVDGKPTITRIDLVTEGKVAGIDQATFAQTAQEAKEGCPISRLLKPGLQQITVKATLK